MNVLEKSYLTLITGLLLFTGLTSCDKAEDGIGYEDADKYGKISITFTGTSADDEDFIEKKEFKFVTSPGDTRGGVDDFGNYFVLSRYDEALNEEESVFIAGWFLPEVNFYNFQINTWIEKNGYVFSINENLAGYTDSFSDIEYDEKTGRLKFSFDITMDAENNDTGHELRITGTADLITFQQIQND